MRRELIAELKSQQPYQGRSAQAFLCHEAGQLLENLTVKDLPWDHRNSAPRHVYVLLRGPSGVSGVPYRYMAAKHDADFRPRQPWVDIDGDSVEDCGWNLERDLIEWVAL